MSNTAFVPAPIALGNAAPAYLPYGHGVTATDGAVTSAQDIVTHNPSPNASAPTAPASTYREVVISR